MTPILIGNSIVFPHTRNSRGECVVWELGPSTRDANRIRQTQPAVPETLTESERKREQGK